MPLSAFALLVLAGFILSRWNITAKKAGGDVRFVALLGGHLLDEKDRSLRIAGAVRIAAGVMTSGW